MDSTDNTALEEKDIKVNSKVLRNNVDIKVNKFFLSQSFIILKASLSSRIVLQLKIGWQP